MSKRSVFFECLTTASVVILIAIMISSSIMVRGETDQNIWIVHDVIQPTANEVRWTETGTIGTPVSWISDGSWIVASMRESLVNPNDIFVSLFEVFNWDNVWSTAEDYYNTTFGSFNGFASVVQANTSPWLKGSWNLDTQWYGISQNTTKVEVSYNETNDHVDLSIWLHITHVPEYLTGSDELSRWLTGFDLTPISIGNMQLWQLYEDWTSVGTGYQLQFEAPANILTHTGTNYTCTLPMTTSYAHHSYDVNQVIDIDMPFDTVTRQLTPKTLCVPSGNNVGSFLVMNGDLYPEAFTVVSAAPTQNTLNQVMTAWFTTPGGLGATASLIVLGFTAFRGKRIYNRNNLYHRIYRSMVTLYDLYSTEETRFRIEMDTVSKNIFKMMLDAKINDEQFEKLLRRRDDLLERAQKERNKLPPQP
jgi:hypothetical protein